MTNDELNTKLYKKMLTEQEKYREWLLAQPAEELINHAYEYTLREEILLSFGYNDFTDAQCKALLKSPGPLADIFKDWEKRESSHMDEIFDTISSRANAVLREDFLKKRSISLANEIREER